MRNHRQFTKLISSSHAFSSRPALGWSVVNSQKSVLRMFSSVSLVSRKEREQLESLEKELYGVRDNQAALIEIKMRSLHQKKISETLLTEFMELEIEIQAIIDKGPDIVRTNLETAVRSNLLLEVAIFLRHSADVNALDSRGRGYLEMSPSLQMGNLLIEYGYDFNRTLDSGITILHLSVGCAHIDVVRMLLETEGMDVMAKTDYLLSTPLHGCNHPRIAELLLSHGADPNALNAFGETPLLTVTTCGDWQTYLLLILAGGDWTRASSENITPIQSLGTIVVKQLAEDQTPTYQKMETERIQRCLALLKYFQGSLDQAKTPPITPSHRRQFINDTLLSLAWKSQSLLCKDPLAGYMDATHLPRELMDIVMTYVGLTNLQKTGSSLAEFYRIQHKAIEEREKRRVFDAQTVWFEKHEPKIRIGLLVTLCVVTIVAVVWLRSYAREMIAMEDVI